MLSGRFQLSSVISALLLASCVAAGEPSERIRTLDIPGDLTDLSDLRDVLEGGVPHSQLGGFSAIDVVDDGHRLLVLPDRGPSDGAVPYLCRFHEAELDLSGNGSGNPAFRIIATHLLKDEQGRSFRGRSDAIDPDHPERSLRLDPEGIRVGRDGLVYICDEYGPHILAFDRLGQLVRRLTVPGHLKVSQLRSVSREEDAANTAGRQSNRGFEGLAISPDARRLYAILQSPLLQDHALSADGKRSGTNVRFIEYDLESDTTREFVYVLGQPDHGISEVLMIDEHRLLVLERDNKAGVDAVEKKLFEADLREASDVTGIIALPAQGLPTGVRAIKKRLFLDLLDPRFAIPADQISARLEGLTFVNSSADRRRILLLCSDNDFVTAQPSRMFVFSVDCALR